jgi:competence protein ComEC
LLLVFAILYSANKEHQKTTMKYFVLFLSTYLFVYLLTLAPSNPKLVVDFWDVGEGDSVYIGNKKDLNILVDGGPSNDSLAYLNKFQIFPKCNLTHLFVTHPHTDHIVGLIQILNYCEVEKFTFNDVSDSLKRPEDWATIKSEIIEKNPNTSADKFNGIAPKVFTYGKLKIYVLWPLEDPSLDLTLKDFNEMSLVLLLDYGEKEVLLTGDAEISSLQQIPWDTYLPLIDDGLDVLKVGHHGSKKALNGALLALLKPKKCVISVGTPNVYGHPTAQTLALLSEYHCQILRTDQDGSIEFALE